MASDRIRGNPRRKIVLLDTSALFMIFEQSIRIEDELTRLIGSFDIKIIQDIYNEITHLKKDGTGKQQRLANMVLQLINKYDIIPNTSQTTVDDTLFHMAKTLDAIVVTNDRGLRQKLINHGITTLCLRGKNQLMIC